MKDIMIAKKAKEKERLSESIMNSTAPTEIALALGLIDLVRRYIWGMSNANMDTAKKLDLTSITKYWKYTRQVELELD